MKLRLIPTVLSLILAAGSAYACPVCKMPCRAISLTRATDTNIADINLATKGPSQEFAPVQQRLNFPAKSALESLPLLRSR
jgi:hypothetical protein